MQPRVYYNEHDRDAAAWLRDLIVSGDIPLGDVDERSIVDVQPGDVAPYTSCHFFAGIGGWPFAFRRAGWPDERPVWSGSCPCQPFSQAGKGRGVDDPRHLWPHFFRLIRARRPPVVMGEQVARKAGYGWLDGVRSDLEAESYASRAVDIPACSIDAPHIRSRIYWIGMADTPSKCREGSGPSGESAGRRQLPPGRYHAIGRNGSFYADAEPILCHDGKARRAKPGIPLLAHGVPARVVKWRGLGNAICPPLAVEVITAFLETEGDT